MAFDRRRGAFLGSLFVLAALALRADAASTVTGLTVALHAHHAPAIVLHHRDRFATSSNWSGYAVTGSNGSVQDVRGSWTVPTVTCDSGTEYSSFWVGIDGFNSNTVEQIGTDADCHSGAPAYYAWFEFYPHPMFTINNFGVQPGDFISAHVHYDQRSRQFTVTIQNARTSQSFSTSTKVNSAQRSSAEWIAEAPSSAGGILPLADFGIVSYASDTATMNGATDPIGWFGTSNVYAVSMVDNNGNAKAVPSPLASDNSSFSVQWMSAGP